LVVNPPSPLPPAIVIAGPTASGKSALALAVAREFGGTVINADSMQVYSVLRILTDRPSDADVASLPHRLYGVLHPSETCSAARWRDMAAAAMAEAWEQGGLPVLVGGTGLYIRALMEGLSPIPEIPDDIRREARALLAQMGNAAFHGELAKRDPVSAARLDPGNSQRLARAWEVAEATGRTLADWQAVPPQGAVAARWQAVTLLPRRQTLYAACDGRFRAMLAAGALDEAQAMRDLNLDPSSPAMKALGLAPLIAHLEGRIGLDQAEGQASQATRNYAKRQSTWFRHQLPSAMVVGEQFSESLSLDIFSIIRRFLLTAP
jgi:tRNA dimethylallyltransferase